MEQVNTVRMIPDSVGVIDTETTGMDSSAEVIEVGVVSYGYNFCELFSSERGIPVECSAVHHIIESDVLDKPLFKDYAPSLRDDLHRNGINTLVAHNAEFDRKMLGDEFADFAWICTYKCALHVWPDAPKHTNEALCYYLGVGTIGRASRSSLAAHSAYFDSCQTFAILTELAKHATIDQMIAWTKDIKNLPRMPFGKHAGKTWAEIDSGYLSWVTKNLDDADIKELAARELRRRR